MKLCRACNRLTAGDPQFCSSCGRTYDVRLCPRMHVNPRGAQVCSQCGSRDLTTPQPKRSALVGLLFLGVKLLPALALLGFTVAVLGTAIETILRDPNAILNRVVCLGTWLLILWGLFLLLPQSIQRPLRAIGRSMRTNASSSKEHRDRR